MENNLILSCLKIQGLDQRFLKGTQAEDGPDQVKSHASEVGEESKARNEQMQDYVEVGPLVIGNDGKETTECVEDEGAEVGSERYREQRIGQRCELVVRGIAEVGEDVVGQCGNGGVARRSRIGEYQGNREHTDDRGDDSQRPNGAPR